MDSRQRTYSEHESVRNLKYPAGYKLLFILSGLPFNFRVLCHKIKIGISKCCQFTKVSPVECGTTWIFPGYVDMTDGGAASKVTRILAKCKAGGVKGIPANASSHGIRVSAINTMMFHEGLTLSSVIARGGWEHDRESIINCYFT